MSRLKFIYTEYLYKFPEGVSLRNLAPTERGAEPRFIELTESFIQTYAESRIRFICCGKGF